MDVKLEADGFAPHYLWDLSISAGEVRDLGSLTFVPGGSISGWVFAERRLEPGAITVELMPEALQELTVSPASYERRRVRGKIDDRGFFQFKNLQDGSYAIVASAPGFSPSRVSGIGIRGAREQVLREPVILESLGAIHATVQPPLDPYGQPWRVGLQRRIPLSNYLQPVADGPASELGEWIRAAVERGSYVLAVSDTLGGRHARREIDVETGTTTLAISVSALAVKGQIKSGQLPLEATLTFFAADGAKATFDANADGEFTGVLAHEGNWRVEVLRKADRQVHRIPAVAVRPATGKSYAELEIVLPGGRLKGKVVDEREQPVSAAIIHLFQDQTLVSHLYSRSDGTFDAIGLSSGAFWIRAETAEADSGLLLQLVNEQHEGSPVTIVVRKKRNLRVRLLTPGGAGIAGALTRYSGPTMPGLQEAVSGPTGRFTIALPVLTPVLDLIILAPGFPVKMTRVPVPADPQELTVSLGLPAGQLTIRYPQVTPPWPYIRRDGELTAVSNLFLPPEGGLPPRGLNPRDQIFTVEIEAGTYVFCGSPQIAGGCVARDVLPGALAEVDATALRR